MARVRGATLGTLPGEILLHILSFLDPVDIVRLQSVSRALKDLGRDKRFWKSRCLQESSFLEALGRRRLYKLVSDAQPQYPLRRAAVSFGHGTQASWEDGGLDQAAAVSSKAQDRERVRIMANWDPSFPSERISWYDEYIQRHGPVAVNWFQLPHHRHGSRIEHVEARGVALYRPGTTTGHDSGTGTLLAVSPLDNGGVCLWDVHGTRGRRGAIVDRSRPGMLSDSNRRSKRVDSGVTECISIDSWRDGAYFAVQSHLVELDLRTLSVVRRESFPWSITALSTANPGLPLTIGTSLGIHLYDHRARSTHRSDGGSVLDHFDRTAHGTIHDRALRSLFEDDPLPPYAPLAQPGPLKILHLPKPGHAQEVSDDLYVAGRFSNILHYDRRKFPHIMGSIHSGARLCSLESLPYPFSPVDSELRRHGVLSVHQLDKAKAMNGGRTLIACGEYNTKGSLEIYGLSSAAMAQPNEPGGLQDATLKNRQTVSDSKLLSVVQHGTRIAFSDGSGCVKWFERDGFTEVRRIKIGPSETAPAPSLFSSMPGSDDIARKLLPTRSGDGDGADPINDNHLLFWTGEKLGLLTFSSRPAVTADEFEAETAAVDSEKEGAIRAYTERMRQALQTQADDVRFVRKLGMSATVDQPMP